MDELVEDFVERLEQVAWPEARELTPAARAAYEAGLDLVYAYRGDPVVLDEALEVFLRAGALPYACAGAAALLMAASYISNDDYDADGLQAARVYLERARRLAPSRIEIDYLEAPYFLFGQDLARTRRTLDALAARGNLTYHVGLIEIRYWGLRHDAARMDEWFEWTMQRARSKQQQINALNCLAGACLRSTRPERGLEAYHRLARLDPNDPWLWHNLSILHADLNDYAAAAECNRRALSLMDFPAARGVEAELKRLMRRQRPFERRP